MSLKNRIIAILGSVALGLALTAINAKPVAGSKPGAQPVSIQGAEQFPVGVEFANSDAVYTVPAGKRLVVQYVSGEVILPAGQAITRQIVAVEDPSQPGVGLSAVYLPTSSTVPCNGTCSADQLLVINQAVTLYAEAGQTINFGAARNGSTGSGIILFNAIGYLVDREDGR